MVGIRPLASAGRDPGLSAFWLVAGDGDGEGCLSVSSPQCDLVVGMVARMRAVRRRAHGARAYFNRPA